MRKARGITQEQLALSAGLDLRYLGSIERGKGNPSVAVLGRIADALHTHPAAFFADFSSKTSQDSAPPNKE
jgi:transcriptional regulator with XRE-family HTH domain